MITPYAYIQNAKDGQDWLFMGDNPIVPIHRRIGQTICDHINADRDALLLARFACIEPSTEIKRLKAENERLHARVKELEEVCRETIEHARHYGPESCGACGTPNGNCDCECAAAAHMWEHLQRWQSIVGHAALDAAKEER